MGGGVENSGNSSLLQAFDSDGYGITNSRDRLMPLLGYSHLDPELNRWELVDITLTKLWSHNPKVVIT